MDHYLAEAASVLGSERNLTTPLFAAHIPLACFYNKLAK